VADLQIQNRIAGDVVDVALAPTATVCAFRTAQMAHDLEFDRIQFLYSWPSRSRVRLFKEICPWLGFDLGQSATLYAQSFPYGVEVMSMEHRFARLLNAESERFPRTFKSPSYAVTPTVKTLQGADYSVLLIVDSIFNKADPRCDVRNGAVNLADVLIPAQ
jgi:hypothetical protein